MYKSLAVTEKWSLQRNYFLILGNQVSVDKFKEGVTLPVRSKLLMGISKNLLRKAFHIWNNCFLGLKNERVRLLWSETGLACDRNTMVRR